MLESFSKPRQNFEEVLQQSLKSAFVGESQNSSVYEACAYALSTGGKRFRPLLCYAAGEAMQVEASKVDPWAVAIEYVHTYSLIHDDLPAMDNDDYRRGLPTVHKKFDEATALLAGDALLTEAFGVVSRGYQDQPSVGMALVTDMVRSTGGNGMILGQALDFAFSPQVGSLQDLQDIHLGKTGELMSLCLLGVARLANVSSSRLEAIKNLGLKLGFAFQLKDDLLDGDQGEDQSYIRFLGTDGTHSLLETTSKELSAAIVDQGFQASPLETLVRYNLHREK